MASTEKYWPSALNVNVCPAGNRRRHFGVISMREDDGHAHAGNVLATAICAAEKLGAPSMPSGEPLVFASLNARPDMPRAM